MTENGSIGAESHYRTILERLSQGDYAVEKFPADDPLGSSFSLLIDRLRLDRAKRERLNDIILRVNSGLFLGEILDEIYQDFKSLIPYDRIGVSFVDDNANTVRAHWAKSDNRPLKLVDNFTVPLAGSSLADILQTGRPRILNDLEEYLRNKPQSISTRFIVEEGFRSSLTCPLVINGKAIGFIFFSSLQPNTYAIVHVEDFIRVADQMSAAVEKGRMASELLRSREQIESQNENLRKLSEKKNMFLGMAAHDLRGPIGFAKMAAERILAGDSTMAPEIRRSFLSDIIGQSTHMLALLNDLLDFSHIESGTFQLHPVPVVVADFLRETVERQSRLAEPKKTRVEMEPAPQGKIQVDPFRLRQAMDNLISNAIKYAPAGSLVLVRANRSNGFWRVEVQDEGPGLTEDDQERLFQDFARLSARPTGNEKGTGLGLAIARRLIEAHGGAIGVHSIPGQGATFHVTLPAAAA